jgi:AcrR family transcriptional regulator
MTTNFLNTARILNGVKSSVGSVPNESRRDRQRRELKRDIIAEASRRLENGGPSAVTLRGIAREVGVSAPALYTYFPSLSELFTELIVQSYRSLEAGITGALDASAGSVLEQRLVAGPIAYRAWAITHPRQFNLAFFDQIVDYAAPPDGPTVSAQTDVLKPIAAQYAEARGCTLAELEADGELLDDFLGWWGAFHGIVALEVNHHLDWREPENIFRRHLGSSVRYLLTTAPTTRGIQPDG